MNADSPFAAVAMDCTWPGTTGFLHLSLSIISICQLFVKVVYARQSANVKERESSVNGSDNNRGAEPTTPLSPMSS